VSTLPLEGITVVAVEQAVAAPVASRHLADLGARVIKIERPDGGDFARRYDTTVRGLSSWFVWANRSKESVVLDLKLPDDRAALDRLVATADVFLHNLAPTAARRLGLDPDTLLAAHPRLVACEISGYGAGGPRDEAKAYDLLIQAEAGVLEITGTPDERVKAGVSIADIAAAMYAYSGILAALLTRARTGRGSAVRVAMLDALAEWMSAPLYYATYGGVPPERRGARHATIAPYEPFTTADGDVVVIGIQNDREWRRFCAVVLGDDALATDPRFASNEARIAHVEELARIVADTFGALGTAAAVDRLNAAGVAYSEVNDLAGVWGHPQLRARDRFVEIDSPAGPITVLRPPAEPEGGARFGAVPALGQHTEEVLRSTRDSG
jgi:itaconate CoA-transferase